MNINWTDVFNVILALAIFKVLDVLFLGDMLANITGAVSGS